MRVLTPEEGDAATTSCLTKVVHELLSDDPAAADDNNLHGESPDLSPASRGRVCPRLTFATRALSAADVSDYHQPLRDNMGVAREEVKRAKREGAKHGFLFSVWFREEERYCVNC